MASAEPLPCPAWIWSNNSAHVAKDRSWFDDDYVPFKCLATDHFGSRIQVEGIGTVELPVKKSPSTTGPSSHGTLRLLNVLHVPTTICNILGNTRAEGYHVQWGPRDTGSDSGKITDIDGRSLAYFKPKSDSGLYEVRLSGPPVGPRVGPSPFQKDAMYMINVQWVESERRRWETHKAGLSRAHHGEEALTITEKQWLKTHYGNEFKFLVAHGLSIHKEDDREEGRSILRALMSQSGGEEDSDVEFDDKEAEDEGDEEEADEEDEDEEDDDLEGHFADYNFTADELDFIKAEYGNSMTFMYSFGLKFYDDEDCEEAKVILRALMAEDKE